MHGGISIWTVVSFARWSLNLHGGISIYAVESQLYAVFFFFYEPKAKILHNKTINMLNENDALNGFDN